MAEQGRKDTPGMEHGAGIGAVRRSLLRVRRAAWGMLVAQQTGRLVAWFVGALVLAVVLDYFLRTPVWMRAGMWAGGALLVGMAFWRWVRPALRFRPALTEVALKIEQSEAGKAAGLRGILAAGLELGSVNASEPVVRTAVERFGRVRTSSVMSGTRLSRVIGATAGVLVVAAGLSLAFPSLAGIGAERILTPWSGAQWPKRTAIADATDQSPHARGSGLLLRAVVLKNVGGLGMDDRDGARVWGKYRVVVDGEAGSVRRVLLTGQNRTEDVVVPVQRSDGADEGGTAVREGALFEYLIEPWGLTPGTRGAEAPATASATTAELEYWFESEDDATPVGRVLLVEPPSVVGATAEITAPVYAVREGGVKRVEMGMGETGAPAATPMLAGSRIRVVVELNKAVPDPLLGVDEESARASRLKDVVGESGARAMGHDDASVVFGERSWIFEWTLREATTLNLHIEDEHGIAGPDAVYSFAVLEDRVATAAVTMPDEDRTVLPNALVELTGEGRDDVGLEWAALEYRVAEPPSGSEGAPPEAGGASTELARVVGERASAEGGTLPRELVVRSVLDLSSLGVEAGDEVWVTAAAADAYLFEGASHEVSRSLPRKLRIISEEQLIEQVWAELSGVRRSAMATEEEQSRLTRDVERGGEASRMERAQASVSDRISRDREALDRIGRRLEENELREETLEQVLREAKRHLDEAGKASVRASEKLREAGAAEQQAGGADEARRAEAGREQDEVREDLGRLIDLLDQGQDTWAMKRAIERLLEEQRSLRDRTGEAGQRTTGKQTEQLTAREREELERIAEEQRALSQEAAEAVQRMTETEPKLRKSDPASADAMSQAARQAQQQQLTEKMEQASQQVQQNQTNRAQQEQDQAIQAMEQMLESLQNSARNRDEVLRRKLASLIESIEGLIKDQTGQLALLEAAIGTADFTGLDRGMARLHLNTLGVLDEAAEGPRELQEVADLIQEAATAQSNAAVALRVQPINSDEAKSQEEISLEKLTRAKEAAEQLDQEAANRQAQRKRAELKKAYREAMTEQVAIRAETEPLVAVEQTRRTRATARTLGERQGALQDSLATLERETKELSEAVMFSFAHRRLDDAIGAATKRLGEGDADREVTRRQDAAVRVLSQILQALEEGNPEDEEFRQQSQPQQQGGSGQQGGGPTPVVPPMAEVKLLRSMQEEIGVLTREAEASRDAAAIGDAAGLQGELAAQGQSLLKKLTERRQEQGQPSPAGTEESGAAPGEDGGVGKEGASG